MSSFLKQLFFLWTILFANFLWADGDDISISIANTTVNEDDGTITFTITLSEVPDDDLVVNYTTHDSSAKAGQDYIAKSGSVTFSSGYFGFFGDTTKTVTINIIDDNIHENTEKFYVKISNSTIGYIITKDKGYGTIYDNDKPPLKAKIHNRIGTENTNSTLDFTVELNQNAPNNITLNYTTIDNTAKHGTDYTTTNGVLTILKNHKYGYISVPIIGDDTPESTEQFKVKISSISEGTITRDTAIGTIKDDDAIKVDITSSDVNEGNSGEHHSMKFKIFLTKNYPLDTDLVIDYTTQDGSSPSATAGEDYIAKSGSVTFHKGDKEKIINVPIIGDNTIEDDENLKMVISGSSYIIDNESESEIINDDGEYPAIDFSTGNFNIVEGNSSTKILNFHFELDAPALANSYFKYYTKDDEAKVSDNDYVKIATTTYNIPKGTKSIDIPVTINGDTKIEEDEHFYLKIKNGSEHHIVVKGHTAKGDILNDDGSYPTLSFTANSYSINEGDSGQKNIFITLRLNKQAQITGSFQYRTRDNTSTSNKATADDDYQSIPYTTYPIHIGDQNITIPIKINGDKDIENDEDFTFEIKNHSEHNITIAHHVRKVTILNDDGNYPTINIASSTYSVIEGNVSQKNLEINLTLDAPALKDTSIKYYTADGSAKDGSSSTEDKDYISTKGKLDIEENSTVVSINIPILGDTFIEPDEKFKFYIHNPKNLHIGRSSSTITIVNDDTDNNDPFTCDKYMYISSSKKRGSNQTGKMWLHRIDTTENPFRFEVIDDNGESQQYNATAYNPDDNYIYALYHRELVKLTKSGKLINIGKITGLPAKFDTKQLYAGAINKGYYFVTGLKSKQKHLYKIRLSDLNVTDINLTKKVAIQDFSFYYEGNRTKYLYGVDKNGKLTKINSTNGVVKSIGNAHTGYAFDSSFSYRDKRFFANDSNGNGFFEFNLKTGEKYFISSSQSAKFNDGANCINAKSPKFNDYGDAPKSYGKAWHRIIKDNPYLGNNNADKDNQPNYSENADGDDINGIDDEDGVTLSDGSDINGTYFDTNATHTIKVKLSKDAYLKVWIDKEINGHFTDSNDLVYNSVTKLGAGEHNISFSLPANLKTGKTYLRARVSSKHNMNPTGFVTDGEVEDYMIYFGKASQPLKGVFNIERTDSNSLPINSQARNAWFTQIASRDFDYSLVFYKEDMSQEQILDNVTVKIELIDEDTNTTLYTKYAYIKNSTPKSRIDNTLPHDLDILPATKRARFRIYYGVDSSGNIIQSPCSSYPQTCFNSLPQTTFVDAKDDFAIRPDYYYMTILDSSNPIRVNTHDNNTPLRVSAGYDYNLTIVAYDNSGLKANGYTINNIKRVLEFLDKSNSACPIKDDYNSTDSFINGKNTNHLLEIKEVGNYRLGIIDNIWTQVDSIKGDCDINSSASSANGNIKVGCNIVSPDINLSSYPDHFDINLTMKNLPNSSHPDFIYMSEINSTYNSVALSYQGNIVAKNANNEITKNFTAGYFAQDVKLELNATTLSDRGVNQPLKTSDGTTAVNFAKTVEFNSDGNITRTLNPILSNLSIINIPFNQFTNEHNGTADIDIRYNIDKNISKTINPIQITFHGFEANSINSNSISHGKETPPYTPTSDLNLGDSVRNFYFAKVTPDRVNYPRVYTTISRVIRTPLSVDIFCDVNSSYCTQTGVLNNTVLTGTTREQTGWYISTNHNGDKDGNVTTLIDNPSGTVTLIPNPTPLTPLTLPNGHNGLESAKFVNCNNQKVEVTIITDPVLAYQANKYILSCTDNNASEWTGVGRAGNILEVKPKLNRSGKMDW